MIFTKIVLKAKKMENLKDKKCALGFLLNLYFLLFLLFIISNILSANKPVTRVPTGTIIKPKIVKPNRILTKSVIK